MHFLSAYPVALGGGKVPPVQCTPGNHNVTLGSMWVGEVYLLQNDDSILEIIMEEMNLHRRPCRRPSWTPLNGAVPRSTGGREGHHVGTWIPTRGRCFPMPPPNRFLPMLRLHMDRQNPGAIFSPHSVHCTITLCLYR